ncbi:MAG: CoA transferase [Proteobacteria bacterium]|nr:CoA transferase [Pseudomonadota bacterium]
MGPLSGFRMIEIAGIGPGQFCGMLLADMGAQLIRVDRTADADPGIGMPSKYNLMNRSRPAIGVDLKSQPGVDLVLRLCENADALFEGFRPGVMERLGLGPDDCMARNERLVYGRMTGWGQTGPLAGAVGHDGNYAALTGVIAAIGEKDGPPSIPLNLTADFGGGGAYLAIGILAALLEASRSGKGQVVDAAMVDGAASLMTMFYGLHAAGFWRDQRGSNILDGAAPFYRAYRTSDDTYVIVCAIERRFFKALIELLAIDDIDLAEQHEQSKWPAQIERFEAVFASKTRDEWCELLEGTNACFAPVLSLAEAPKHPHNEARKTFVTVDGILQPAAAPRFSRTKSEIQNAPGEAGENDRKALLDWGLSELEVNDLL